MYRTLLKLLIYEVIEKIARFELLLKELAADSDAMSPALVEGLQQRLEGLKEQVLEERTYINQLFSDKATKERDSLEKLTHIAYGPYQELGQLSQLLNSFLQGNVLSETHLFLQDALGDKFSAQRQRQTVIFQAEGEQHGPDTWQLENLFIEAVSVLNKNNPLGWVGLTQAFAKDLVQQSHLLDAVKPAKKGQSVDEKILRPLATSLVSLRLLGPAYYYYAVTQALLKQDAFFLTTLEPALFYGLNHLNFTDKSLVILHEATEKSRELLFPTTSKAQGHPIEKEVIASLLRQVEKVIPEKTAFTEKQFKRSVQLQDRLGQGILLSSSRLHPLEEVHETLTLKTEAAQDPRASFPIYEILNMVSELPNTPLEIVNAGWIHKLDRGPVWLYTAFNGADQDTEDGFERLVALVDGQDRLLLKSIETSEVHRVLLCGT